MPDRVTPRWEYGAEKWQPRPAARYIAPGPHKDGMAFVSVIRQHDTLRTLTVVVAIGRLRHASSRWPNCAAVL